MNLVNNQPVAHENVAPFSTTIIQACVTLSWNLLRTTRHQLFFTSVASKA